LAEHIQEGLQDVSDDYEEYLVAYDFVKSKPAARFWRNLDRLLMKGSLVQRSVFLARGRRAAEAVSVLAHHYGADVAVFLVKRENE